MNQGLSHVSHGNAQQWKIASRVNSFLRTTPDINMAIQRMAAVPGLTALELNYPQHVVALGLDRLMSLLEGTRLPLTALNLRFEGPSFARGAFSSPDHGTQREAVRIACDAVDLAARCGAGHVVLWMADDGWDYPFQVDYHQLWSDEIAGFRAVADRNAVIRVSVEYKPFEPRRFSLIRSMSDALLAVNDVDRVNFGVTLDVCHSYMAGEHPPAAAAAALRQGKLFGVHLNDGYGTADDGLMVAAVHERDTLELLHVLRAGGYDGTLYFDTFPVREDPSSELLSNIGEVERLQTLLDRLDLSVLQKAQDNHDAIAVLRTVIDA